MGSVLTAERIVDTAESLLRHYGLDKTTVVDVARALGVSHGSVYRHFPSKAALRDAVVARVLARVSTPLSELVPWDGHPQAGVPESASSLLRRWLVERLAMDRKVAEEDPQLFEACTAVTIECRDVVSAHVRTLTSQVARIIEIGIATGEFAASDAEQAGQAVMDATVAFQHPVHRPWWSQPSADARHEALIEVLIAGLHRSSEPTGRAKAESGTLRPRTRSTGQPRRNRPEPTAGAR